MQEITTCRNTNILYRSIENTDKGFRKFGICRGIQNTFPQESSPKKISETPHMNVDQRHQVQLEINNMLKK